MCEIVGAFCGCETIAHEMRFEGGVGRQFASTTCVEPSVKNPWSLHSGGAYTVSLA